MNIEYTSDYLIAVADQLSFVSTFLGGVSVTILITIVVFSSSKKSTNALVVSSALSACALLISVISAWRLNIALHPDLPLPVEIDDVFVLFRVMILAYSFGFISLIVSIGISGWLRSKAMGIFTSSLAAMTLLLFLFTSTFL